MYGYGYDYNSFRGQPGTTPVGPPTSFPGGMQPGGPPPSFPGGMQPGGPGQISAPTSPPPSFTPQQQPGQPQLFAVDPGAIQGCLFQFTYIWLEGGYRSFWFYPVFVGRRSVAGFRWTGYRWVYFGIDLNRIDSFQCF